MSNDKHREHHFYMTIVMVILLVCVMLLGAATITSPAYIELNHCIRDAVHASQHPETVCADEFALWESKKFNLLGE